MPLPRIKRSHSYIDIIELTERSAEAKTGISIFELGNMGDLMSYKQAEHIREQLVENNVHTRQLTNRTRLAAWTGVTALDPLMDIRYVDPDIFDIKQEMVIFDDTVARYIMRPSVIYEEINLSGHAATMRRMFDSVWQQAMIMERGPGGSAWLPS